MPPTGKEVVSEEDCLDGVLGFEVVSIGDGEAVARFPVADRVRQRFGLVHGGAYAALAEMIATEATVAVVHPDGFAAGDLGKLRVDVFSGRVARGLPPPPPCPPSRRARPGT